MNEDTRGPAAAVPTKEVPVVPLKWTFPGLSLRILADRDEGSLIWETSYLGPEGEITRQETRRLEAVELTHLEDLCKCLLEARDALTPPRRLDKARLEPPSRGSEDMR